MASIQSKLQLQIKRPFLQPFEIEPAEETTTESETEEESTDDTEENPETDEVQEEETELDEAVNSNEETEQEGSIARERSEERGRNSRKYGALGAGTTEKGIILSSNCLNRANERERFSFTEKNKTAIINMTHSCRVISVMIWTERERL